MSKIATDDKTRREQAESRTAQAEARTQSAETRTEMAKTRTEQAETRAEQAETRTEQAESRTEIAETRAEQAEIRSEQAITALQAVVHGEAALAPIHKPFAIASVEGPGLLELTVRQREILQFIAQGETTKTIADSLKLSPKTVEYHRVKLMDRLKVHDVPGLVRFAVRVGLVSDKF